MEIREWGGKKNPNVQFVTSPVLGIINHSCAATANRDGLSFAKRLSVSLHGLHCQ